MCEIYDIYPELALMSLCIIFAMQSCTSDQEPIVSETQKAESDISHLVIKFEDRIYETDVMTVGDSTIYLNEEFAEVYNSKIAENPNTAVLAATDEVGNNYVEYFASEKKLMEKYDFIQLDSVVTSRNIATRGNNIILVGPENIPGRLLARAELYDDKNWSDTKLIMRMTTGGKTEVAKLNDFGFNDKTSSIIVYNHIEPTEDYGLRFPDDPEPDMSSPHYFGYKGRRLRPILVNYHNSNFSGGVLFCVGAPSGSSVDHADYNLRKIGWNDKISSVTWVLVKDFSLPSCSHPEITPHKDNTK